MSLIPQDIDQLTTLDHYQLNSRYLNKIQNTLNKSLYEHPRTFVIRFDLRFPKATNCIDCPPQNDEKIMSKFIDSFKAQVAADLNGKRLAGKRVHGTSVRYCWARERCSSLNDHFHVTLFLNNDTYNSLGRINGSCSNTRIRIAKAWASALGIDYWEARGLVYYSEEYQHSYNLSYNNKDFVEQYSDVFRMCSYLAKNETKPFGEGKRVFGSSIK